MALVRFTNRPALTRPFLDDLPERMRQMFEGTLPFEPFAQPLGLMPAMEIVDKDEALFLTAELPGVDSKDVEITVEDGVLTIRGEKKEVFKADESKFFVWERRYGSFQRTFALPPFVDFEKVTAKFDNGVLTLTFPKSEKAKVHGKKIPISVGK